MTQVYAKKQVLKIIYAIFQAFNLHKNMKGTHLTLVVRGFT